ncbi:hypothetical protein [Vibrio hippocampi]|uniref:Secreted protein n=1 Tax=Vibrio hippocampi TaxID=654686 RepID=A0ABN8DKW0_9VIBR|nr:hypothetical protein [Vibrio hippocampi]CAH0529745.1 hypothetical protein VHP8226_03501 [Vibrio hippocampi]
MRVIAIIGLSVLVWGCASSDTDMDSRAMSEKIQHEEQIQQQRCAALGDLNCQ